MVSQIRTPETDGYSAVQLAFGAIDPRKVNKPTADSSPRPGDPRRDMVELRTDDASEYTLGQELKAEVFAAGDLVDVTATSKGKGFAGVMKRHGFPACAPATVCTASTARRVRSVAAPPGPGFQGSEHGRTYGLRPRDDPGAEGAVGDAERNLILIKGAVPGPKGAGAYPRHREGRMSMTSIDIKTPGGDAAGSVELPAEVFNVQTNVPPDPPGGCGATGRRPAGDAQDEDPRRGRRWWPQAVPAEGHRPRPSGFGTRSAVRRRRCGPWPDAAQLRAEDPKKMKAAVCGCFVRPRSRRPRARGDRSGRGGLPPKPQ